MPIWCSLREDETLELKGKAGRVKSEGKDKLEETKEKTSDKINEFLNKHEDK